MKVAIYSRFSTDRQDESSIADQVRVCTEYAERQDWKVTQRFEDQGISGAALGNRPGVLRLQELALARQVDVVLVTDLSRLSRSTGDLTKMIDRLVAKGVRVIGVQDGYDSARRGHKLQAGLAGIIGEAFRDMVRDRTYAALESRAKEGRAVGGRAYGYRAGRVDRGEAFIVNEIFGRFADGEGYRTIAADLNKRNIPSPGSSWNRTERRRAGWMCSGVRAILLNPRYTGVIRWNTSEWVKDPDTGKRLRRMRPRSEWIERHDESLRIVSDNLFARAQRRLGKQQAAPVRSGGKLRYLLSGLLKCDSCDAHYVLVNGNEYGCSSHRNGGTCDNAVRIRRDRVEDVMIGSLRDQLFSPESIATIQKDMREALAKLRQAQRKAPKRSAELQALIDRIARLRARLRTGDPDMTADELQAALDRAEEKRRDLESQQPENKGANKVIDMLPRVAEGARQEIAKALNGDSRASMKARIFVRDAYSGEVRLVPDPEGGLVAHWDENRAALLGRVGTSGSGGRI